MTRKLITIAVCLLLLTGCQTAKKQPSKRSMYYWSTTFKLSTNQQHFLKTQHISRLYVRFFDVVTEPDGTLMPNATIRSSSFSEAANSRKGFRVSEKASNST